MARLTADKALREQLNGLEKPVEFCDEEGRTLGFFLSEQEYKQLVYAWARNKYSDEELDRRAREPGARTTAEVLAALSKQ